MSLLKKLIITICIFMTLFTFSIPKQVYAGIVEDVIISPAVIFYYLEVGVMALFNNIFTDDRLHDQGHFYCTPETVIKGKFLLMEPNIFKDVKPTNENKADSVDDEGYFDVEKINGETTDEDTGKTIKGGRTALRNTLSSWYRALRGLAIVALLSILVYIAIRMIISSASQDKAKYKVMFKDWLVALCLLFAMHYIMIGVLTLSSLVTRAVGTSGGGVDLTEKAFYILNNIIYDGDIGDNQYLWTVGKGVAEGESEEMNKRCNLKDGEEFGTIEAYSYVLLAGVAVVYTVMFIIKYLKRMITIVFLILIAPISCITYPLDKISDGKAQAYNRWFQEFFYQVMIQPFHLLIYLVLMGSAAQLAKANILYSIMCFAVMIPAEKFIKEMFGFKDKLGSPLGAMATGAAAKYLLDKAKGIGSSGGKGGTGGKGDETGKNNIQNSLPPKTTNKGDLIEGEGTDKPQIGEGVDSAEPIDGDMVDSAAEGALIGGAAEEASAGDDDSGVDRVEDTLNGEQDQETANNLQQAGDELEKNQELNDKEKGSESSNENQGKKDSKWNRFKGEHERRMNEKYGTARRSKRWKKRAGKGLKALAKGTLKGAAIGGLGAIAMTTALATGNGKAALGIASGLTSYAASKAYKGGKKAIKGATGAVKSYHQAGAVGLPWNSGKDIQENLARKAYMDDPENARRARQKFMKDNNNVPPSNSELREAMEDRYTLSRHGLSDDEIDKLLPTYQEEVKKLKASGKDENRAQEIAANKAKHTAGIGNSYSAKDFRDPNKSQRIFENIANELQAATGCSRDVANDYAKQYLVNAAKMNGVYIQLPTHSQTIDVDVPGCASALGINSSRLSAPQIQQLEQLNIRMHKKGFNKDEINVIASSVSGSNAEEKIANFEAKVEASIEYIEDDSIRDAATQYLGNGASKNDINNEVKTRFMLTNVTGMKDQNKIDKIRDIENGKGTRGNNGVKVESKTQLQEARELSVKTRGATKGQKQKLEKDLVNRLIEGGLSETTAREQAKDTMQLAGQINSIN